MFSIASLFLLLRITALVVSASRLQVKSAEEEKLSFSQSTQASDFLPQRQTSFSPVFDDHGPLDEDDEEELLGFEDGDEFDEETGEWGFESTASGRAMSESNRKSRFPGRTGTSGRKSETLKSSGQKFSRKAKRAARKKHRWGRSKGKRYRPKVQKVQKRTPKCCKCEGPWTRYAYCSYLGNCKCEHFEALFQEKTIETVEAVGACKDNAGSRNSGQACEDFLIDKETMMWKDVR